jgi:hypothetical protein
MDINGLYLSPSKSGAYAIRETIKEEQSQHTVCIYYLPHCPDVPLTIFKESAD